MTRSPSSLAALLAVAVTVAVGSCGGPGEVGETPGGGTSSGGEGDLTALLPADDAVPGWRRSAEPRFFDADSLWEFINGAADGYLAYGFEEVVTSDYTDQTGRQAVIDIYRMKDPLHAFGIYGQERSPDYEFVDIGTEGYVGGTALNFWRGPYYVKTTVFEDSDELQTEMANLARHVAAKIVDGSSPPAEIGFFPEKDRLARTAQFIPRDVLGQSYLMNGFETRYRSGDDEYKMVLISTKDAEAAREALARYRQFVGSRNPAVQDLAGLGEEGFVGEDSYYGRIMTVRSGPRILAVLGAPTESAGKEALAEMLSRAGGS